MRNRAKCKLCKDEIESLTLHDYVSCSCGEISIDGGSQHLGCHAKDFGNFLRLDDDGRELPVKLVEDLGDAHEVGKEEGPEIPLTQEQKIQLVDHMISYYEELPQHALLSPPTQYDLKAIYLMIKRIL
jgi:hypothetical protein